MLHYFFLYVVFSASVSILLQMSISLRDPTLPLRNYILKHPWQDLFSVHLQAFLEVLPAVQSSVSRENLLVPVSVEGNSTGDVITGALKTLKAEGFSLHACNLVKRKSIRNNFLEFFCKFQSTFKEFGQELICRSIVHCGL